MIEVLVALEAVALLFAVRRLRGMRAGILDSAHELARPLTVLQLILGESTGQDGRSGPVAVELERAAEALAELRLLAHAGAVDPVVRFDLGELASEIGASWSAVAGREGRRLVVERHAEARVACRRSRAAAAISNLVANSVEHGSGTVRLSVTELEGDRLRLEVSDGTPPTAAGRAIPIRAERPGLRGRGLGIAARAARGAGGGLEGVFGDAGSSVSLTLPSCGK